MEPDRALGELDRARQLAAGTTARFLEGVARTADVALRGRHGDPRIALVRYRAALSLWLDAAAYGFVLTALRNLVILLARVGRDAPALAFHVACERLGTKPSYGDEARRLEAAVGAVRERLDEAAASAAIAAGSAVADLPAATRLALDEIDRTLATMDPL